MTTKSTVIKATVTNLGMMGQDRVQATLAPVDNPASPGTMNLPLSVDEAKKLSVGDVVEITIAVV